MWVCAPLSALGLLSLQAATPQQPAARRGASESHPPPEATRADPTSPGERVKRVQNILCHKAGKCSEIDGLPLAKLKTI